MSEVPSAAAKTSPANPCSRGSLQGRRDDFVDFVVGPSRVVVEQREPPHRGGLRDVDGVLDRAVAPPDLLGVFVGEVLGIVDHEVGVAEERNVLCLFAVLVLQAFGTGRAADRRLVVRRVHDGDAIGFDPVTECQRGVMEVAVVTVTSSISNWPSTRLWYSIVAPKSRSRTGKYVYCIWPASVLSIEVSRPRGP